MPSEALQVWLAQGCHALESHALLTAIAAGRLPARRLALFCRLRFEAAAPLLPLLERALQLADRHGESRLREVIAANIGDERGLTGGGSHQQWRDDFLRALGQAMGPQWPVRPSRLDAIYPFRFSDSLPCLSGMLLAVERFTPLEYQAILDGVRHPWPHLVAADAGDAERWRHSRLLVDHIDHDLTRHLPQLVAALPPDWLVDDVAAAEIRRGIAMQLRHRSHLYDDWFRLLSAEQNSAPPA